MYKIIKKLFVNLINKEIATYSLLNGLSELLYLGLISMWVSLIVDVELFKQRIGENQYLTNLNVDYIFLMTVGTVLITTFYIYMSVKTNKKIIKIGHYTCHKMQKEQFRLYLEGNSSLDESEILRLIIEKLPRASDTLFIPFLTILTRLSISVFLTLAMIYVVGVKSILIMLVIIILFILINKTISKSISGNVEFLSKILKLRVSHLKNYINLKNDIYYLTKINHFVEKDSANSFKIFKERNVNSFIPLIPKMMFDCVFVFLIFIAGTYIYFSNTETEMAKLAVLSLLVLRLLPQLQVINMSLNLIKANMWTVDNLEFVFDVDIKAENSEYKIINEFFIDNLFYKIDNYDVTFSNKFRNNNLSIIVGRSGIGKSTLFNKLYQHDKIYFDDEKKINYDFLNYKLQANFALQGTVKENVLFGSKFEKEKFDKCIKIACLNEFIIEKGSSYELSENADNISGGELQRICIARTIYNMKSNILLMDEPTSSLDNVNKELFYKNISEFSKEGNIVIIITHDKIATKYSDEIINFEKFININTCIQ